MKKIIGLLMLSMIMLSSVTQVKAQGTPFLGTATTPATGIGAGVTVPLLNTGADTEYFSFTRPTYMTVCGIQPVVTKLTGTMAGNVVFYGGLYRTPLSTGQTGFFTYVPLGDTLKLSNVTTNSTVFSLSAPVYQSYEAIYSGGTTLTGTLGIQIINLSTR